MTSIKKNGQKQLCAKRRMGQFSVVLKSTITHHHNNKLIIRKEKKEALPERNSQNTVLNQASVDLQLEP